MKRSNMVKIIHKQISKVLRTTKEFDLEDCSKLLDCLEAAGMLPPLYKDGYWEPEHQWEAEDE